MRRFDAPEALDVRFYEVRARSVLNRVPERSRMPFRWTVNPYRGCTHACVYCFARPTHRYLDFDAGRDFEREIVVKVNAPEVLARELARPSWTREHVALGTNTDPYQWVEARYRLMPGIWRALLEHRTPCSVLTKSPLVLRDIAARRARRRGPVQRGAVGADARRARLARDRAAHPHPAARLDAVAKLVEAGIPTSVLVAPLMPGINDDPRWSPRSSRARARGRARNVTPIALHLRSGVREVFMDWLERERPELLGRYGELYARGAYAPAEERRRLTALVRGDRAARAARRASDAGAGARAARRRRPSGRAAARRWRRAASSERGASALVGLLLLELRGQPSPPAAGAQAASPGRRSRSARRAASRRRDRDLAAIALDRARDRDRDSRRRGRRRRQRMSVSAYMPASRTNPAR